MKEFVSIPNGMGFYQIGFIRFFTATIVSIPNGMGFYKSFNLSHRSLLYSFNSQRDGILRYVVRTQKFFRTEFQFPTGWNSTSHRSRFRSAAYRFNSQRDGILQCGWNSPVSALRGFNSQRDGILLASASFSPSPIIVSIPNGMEFYNTARNFTFIESVSFNSQRDGILQKH